MNNEIPQKDKNITWKRLKDEELDNETYYALQREHIVNKTVSGQAGYSLLKLYFTLLINKTNYYLYKVKVDILNDVRGDFFTGGLDQRYIIGQEIYTFYDYNIPVNIELPADLKK